MLKQGIGAAWSPVPTARPRGVSSTSRYEGKTKRLWRVHKWNWSGTVLSSVVGGTIAVVTAPAIAAALVTHGTVGLYHGTMATGVLGSVGTKGVGNASNARLLVLMIYRCSTRAFYQSAVITYIGTALEEKFAFPDLDATADIELSFRMVLRPGTRPRELKEGIAPPDLPLAGACFGATDGALATPVRGGALAGTVIIETVKGKVGVIVGVSSATGVAAPVLKSDVSIEGESKATLFIEFAADLQHHVNRLI